MVILNKPHTRVKKIPLAFAVHSGSKEIIELLIEKGADPNKFDPFTSLPVLALAILFDFHQGVQTLLALGADPHHIPKDLCYIKGISNDAPAAVSDLSDKEKKTSWCTKGMYDAYDLKRSLTPNMIYFLASASRLENVTDTREKALMLNGMRRLPALRLMLIGQEPALTGFSMLSADTTGSNLGLWGLVRIVRW